MQRIESGTLRGRKLLGLPSGVPGLRPTGARVRGAIFDRLQTSVVDTRVLDLFAGSGALSLEAISRGAQHSTMLDVDPKVVRHLGRQLEALGIEGQARVVRADAQRWLAAAHADDDRERFDLVFVDPPFAMPDVFEPIAEALCANRLLAPGARVVCERELRRGGAPQVHWPDALTLEFCRDYGQARVEVLCLSENRS